MIKKVILVAFMAIVLMVAPESQGATKNLLSAPQLKDNSTCKPIGKGAAMSAVARRVNGKVISASLNMRARPPVYRVKVLTNSGRVRYIYVNACTGRVS